MHVLLKIKVSSKSEKINPLTETQIRKLQTSIKRNIISLVDFITIEIGATFGLKNDFLIIGVLQSDPGHDTKLTIQPLIKYLDTDKRNEVKVGKLTFSATLTSKIALWKERNKTTYATTYKARDMEIPAGTFELVYKDNKIMQAFDIYQPLSRLLYCKQLQLNDTEYFERSGLIIANASASRFTTYDFYRVTPTQVRVCTDSYLQALKGKSQLSHGPGIQEISYGLMILSLTLAMVI